jgi:hypothetical protein
MFAGKTLLEMGREILESGGVSARGMSRQELAAAALQTRSGGMMTSSDFSSILAGVANKTLRDGYLAAPQTFRPITRQMTLPDFKPVSRVQLGETPPLERIGEHGEYTRGSMGESKESYSLSTYGKIIPITRQVLINDDTNAFSRVPYAFGVQASNLESNIVWAQILANAPMSDGIALFHASHSNLGSAASISTASVGAGRTLMNRQVGLDGQTLLNITPSFLLVPSALQTVAEQFVGAIYPTTNVTTVPESLRRLVVIAEPRLDNGIVLDGVSYAGSASNWYLAASPTQIDIVELGYLDGEQGPQIETRQGLDVDGMEMRCRLDVAAKVIDHRGLWKNPN